MIHLFIFGTSIATTLFGIFVLMVIAGDFIATLVTVLYQRWLYDRFFRKQYDAAYTPQCVIILPCKGLPKNLEQNLASFLALDYPRYTILFALESIDDPAYQVISQLTANNPLASIVVAGLATRSSQKNHNMLAAIRQSGSADIFVFADADISPEKYWLRDLILPLSNTAVTVTTGFRWLIAKKGTLSEFTHVYINAFLYVGLTFINLLGKTFLWGGSMAIRRKDFEDLKVADVWSISVVDDNSLSEIILKNSRKSVTVPRCVTQSDDLLPTVYQTIAWFSRQIMFCKAHQKLLWLFGVLPMVLAALFIMLWLPLSLILSCCSAKSFLSLGGGAALIFYAGEMATVLLYPLLGPLPRFYKFLILQPLLRITHIVSALRTVCTNKIIWSGIRYHMTPQGKVSKVERLAPRETSL